MKSSTRETIKYLVISFSWTWFCWIFAATIASLQEIKLLTDLTIFNLFSLGEKSGNQFIVQLIFSLGVFGPAIGYIALKKYQQLLGKPSIKSICLVIIVPTLSLVPALILSAISTPYNENLSIQGAILATGLYFLSNLITSGTEEFGWRGFLYNQLKKQEKDFWKISLKGGIIWALWHLPLLIIMYWSMGILMLSVIAGFVASIIAMNYITNAVYEKSNSIVLSAILHALNNTGSFFLLLVFPETPFTVAIAIIAWVFVGLIEKYIIPKSKL